MKARPTPYWKFILGANLFTRWQLDYVERRGDQVIVAVQSGKTCTFHVGQFTTTLSRTKEGNRDFELKSSVAPTKRIVFRETILQMPVEWWSELARRLDASETGLSKLLGVVSKWFDAFND